jgi:hypothetical protein
MNLAMVIGESTADRETGVRKAPSPTARRRHRASSRPYNLKARSGWPGTPTSPKRLAGPAAT